MLKILSETKTGPNFVYFSCLSSFVVDINVVSDVVVVVVIVVVLDVVVDVIVAVVAVSKICFQLFVFDLQPPELFFPRLVVAANFFFCLFCFDGELR